METDENMSDFLIFSYGSTCFGSSGSPIEQQKEIISFLTINNLATKSFLKEIEKSLTNN